MKVEFEKVKETRKRVGFIFHMAGEPEEVCVAYHSGFVDVVFYYDGQVSVQDPFYDTLEEDLIKDVYEGDTVSITF